MLIRNCSTSNPFFAIKYSILLDREYIGQTNDNILASYTNYVIDFLHNEAHYNNRNSNKYAQNLDQSRV